MSRPTPPVPSWMALLLLGLLALPAAARDPATVPVWPDRARAAPGMAPPPDLRVLASEGRLLAGGLEGRWQGWTDLVDGRSRSSYVLGPIEGGEGFDGEVRWSRNGDQVTAVDSSEARARARSDAWLARRGWLSADGARYGRATTVAEDGQAWTRVEAVPEEGQPVVLWFDADGRPGRIDQGEGRDARRTQWLDWREVAGLQVPFRIVGTGDDARSRTELILDRAAPAPAGTDLARPVQRAQDFRFEGGERRSELAFELLNNHIYVDGRIDGAPVRLLFDTGGVNLLTPQAARRLGLDVQGRLAGRGVGEQTVDVGLARAGKLALGGFVLDAPMFYVMDLGDLPAVEGLEFDGLVGYEVFHRVGVRIDYGARRLLLVDSARQAPLPGAVAVPFALEERIPVVQGSIDGRPATLSIDTGSRAALSIHAPFVRQHGLVEAYGARFETVTGWGVGGPSHGWPVRIGELRLGEVVVPDLAADLVTRETGALANAAISANVGSGLLRRYVVEFDYPNRRMYLSPGSEHGLRERHDRAGAWLMRDGDALRIAALAPDGPMQRAGLAVDDRLLAIAGEPVAARSLDGWRRLLRETAPGTVLAVRYRRDGAAADAEVTLADPLADPSAPPATAD